MKRLALLAPAVVALLAACGTADTCTSAPAPLANGGGQQCNLAAGQQVTFTVALNCKCTDTSPSCQAEFLGDHIEVSPVFQQCQENAGCATSGCPLGQPTATCSTTLPSNLSGSVPVTIVGDSVAQATVNISSGTTCSL